jgi:hypothetical protein
MDKCKKCGCSIEDYDCGVCYGCKCDDYMDGKRDSYGNIIPKEDRKPKQIFTPSDCLPNRFKKPAKKRG